MWHHDAMNIIIREFTFIDFILGTESVAVYTGGQVSKYTGYSYSYNKTSIYIGYDTITVATPNKSVRSIYRILKNENIIKKLYEVLPKEFYIQYQRNKYIDKICF